MVTESVVPAYRRINQMFAEQLPRATDDAGVWKLPRGDAYYRHALARHTTTSMTPDEIHAEGCARSRVSKRRWTRSCADSDSLTAA